MTESSLCIFVCDNFLPEVEACIQTENRGDVTLATFPSRCGHPEVNWEELNQHTPSSRPGSALVFGRACIASLPDATQLFPDTKVVHLDQCFHLIAESALVNDAINNGAYLVSPGWLQHWQQHLAAMGFDEKTAGDFFQDFASELLLLDTGIDPETEARFAALQACVKLPAKHLALGLDHVRLLLTKHVNEWRLSRLEEQCANTQRLQNIERADFQSAMDMLTRLAQLHDEDKAINGIKDLFQMLFAPESVHYLRIINQTALPDINLPEEKQAMLESFEADYALTNNGKGFLLNISHDQKHLGKVLVENLAFPEHVQRYLNMAISISGVCGLVIENARNRKKLLEAEKMASLSIVVAGVAHEINTPLGIVTSTASSMKKQTEKLGSQFNDHAMTQNDLQNYLDNIETESALIASNLGKISRLVDQFRQVAVDGGQEHFQNCQLNQTLNEVIKVFGNHFEKARISIEMDLEPDLEVNALTSDWASIFRNLLSNSLKHAFIGKDSGQIFITMHKENTILKLVYSDNGIGMDATSLSKIFDPFFSTDLKNGMGLGMHLVYNLVTHRFQGDIHCESQPDNGLTCTIEVPL